MNPTRGVILFCLAILGMAGCAVRKYQSAPISPVESASRLGRRSLQDSALKVFLEKNLGRGLSAWPLESWDLSTLTLAALYFSPEMEIARARTEGAEAAVITAGARPNPILSVQPGIPSPYLLSLSLDFPIETAGKRGYRIELARQLSAAARFDLANTAWKVRSQVRRAFLDHIAAVRDLELVRHEEGLQSRRVSLTAQRLAVGETARPEVDSARVDLANVQLAVRAAEGRVSETKATLAATIGVPVGALKGARFSWPEVDHPPSVELLSPQQIQRDAVLNRLDVRQALAQYEAAEADLRLQIAKQYPDFDIGPGYTFEERNSFFTLGFATMLPVLNRNQGPIAEAEARRKEAAAHFLAAQRQVMAEGENALASYRAVLLELNQAKESLTKLQRPREQMARALIAAGEADPLTLTEVQVQGVAAAHAELSALLRAQVALGALEDAVQRPLGGEGPSPQPNQISLSSPD